MNKSKRRVERIDLELPTTMEVLDIPGQEPVILEFITQDVSSGGAFIHTAQPLPVNTLVEMDLVLPLDELKKIEGKKAHIKVSGMVVRVNSAGMGICFDEEYEIKPLHDF